MTDELMSEIKAPKTDGSIIMVVGVGGAGGNAVNHMWNLGIRGVTFMVCNTDQQALDKSPVEQKIRLGAEGLGAGNDPENGRRAAVESLPEIRQHLEEAGTRMLFITAGMGGGTGTGASPVI
ncbi:cell division protein FtsZ, partial [Alistipes onderdonkii]